MVKREQNETLALKKSHLTVYGVGVFFFLIPPFPNHCLLVPLYLLRRQNWALCYRLHVIRVFGVLQWYHWLVTFYHLYQFNYQW